MLAAVAVADPPKGKDRKGKGKRKPQHAAQVESPSGFGADLRGKVQPHFAKAHGRAQCPPGLAKKGNG